MEAERRDAILRVLRELAEPLETKIERDRAIADLFNDLDTAIIKRPWFRDLWTPSTWEAILAFDEVWRAAVAKYHKLPPWRQFWASSVGRKVTDEAAARVRLLSG